MLNNETLSFLWSLPLICVWVFCVLYIGTQSSKQVCSCLVFVSGFCFFSSAFLRQVDAKNSPLWLLTPLIRNDDRYNIAGRHVFWDGGLCISLSDSGGKNGKKERKKSFFWWKKSFKLTLSVILHCYSIFRCFISYIKTVDLGNIYHNQRLCL